MENKKLFYVDHVLDVQELVKLGIKPIDMFFYAPKNKLRFVFDNTDGVSWNKYFEIKTERQNK